MTVSAFAQPPQCDTCTYDYDHTWNPKYLDSVVHYTPPQTLSEFDTCTGAGIRKKNISFIHGLGGNIASWDKQKTWTDDNYQTAVIIPTYNGAGWESSFSSVAQKLNNDLGSGLANGVNQSFPNRCPDNDFAIVHSQGGIAARYLDRQWDVNTNGTYGNRKFYGVVSFGTPHAGADIALTRTEHAAFINKVVDAIFLEGAYNLRGLSGKLDKMLDSTGAFIEKSLVPIMIAGVHTNTLDEMAPGSSTMNNINNHQSRLRKVAFYGVEDAPECWRVIDNMTGTPAEEHPIFTATEDQDFVNKAESVKGDHEAAISDNNTKIKRNKKLMAGSTVLTFLPGGVALKLLTGGATAGLVLQNKKLKKNSEHREEAVEFLDNANTEWRYLIGSYHRDSLETVTELLWKANWQEKYGFGSRWYYQERTGFKSQQEAKDYISNVNVYKKKNGTESPYSSTHQVQKFFPSDGVVLQRSQLAFPGVGNRTDKMPGNNHFQERNSPETLRVMEKLYNGDYDYYFTTPEK
ncbi:MAG: esterase/lipase family protein [Bacteroidia bacterium]